MDEYPKIYGPYDRAVEGPDRNKVIPGAWSRPEFQVLADTEWWWTEKVDGTNIRVHWDGYRVEFGGRTDNASIPAKLVTRLRELFPEELFEQVHGGTAVTLHGEGYGAGIQKGGGRYKADGVDFVLFDVRIGGFWLLRRDVVDIASSMGLTVAPTVLVGSVAEAIELVAGGLRSNWSSVDGTAFLAEGVVGVPTPGFLDRAGRRIMMKVKSVDFLLPPPPAQTTALAVAA